MLPDISGHDVLGFAKGGPSRLGYEELHVRINSYYTVYRGGASEASVYSHTDRWCGWQLAIYVSYVRQALGLITPRAYAKGAESAIFEIHFYRERKLWKKEISCSGVGSNLGLMHCRPLHLPPSQWGSGRSGLQIWLLYCWLLQWVLTTVRDHGNHGYLEKANRLRHCKVYLLYSFS